MPLVVPHWACAFFDDWPIFRILANILVFQLSIFQKPTPPTILLRSLSNFKRRYPLWFPIWLVLFGDWPIFLNFGEYFRIIRIKRSILAFNIYILSCQNVNLCLERVEYGFEVCGNHCLPLRVMHAEAGLAVSRQPCSCIC